MVAATGPDGLGLYAVDATGPGVTRTALGTLDLTRPQAVVEAARVARPGDKVVLSPAASSFDAWRSFEHRGEAFQAMVAALPE